MKNLTLLLLFAISLNIYAQDGALDTTFGENGIVNIEGEVFWVEQIQFLEDSKSLLMGGDHDQDGKEYFLLKLNADGSIDNTFGENGRINLRSLIGSPENIEYFPSNFNILSDGKIVVGGGIHWQSTSSTNENKVIVLQFNANGELNTAFANNGKAERPLLYQGINVVGLGSLGRIASTINDEIVVSVPDKTDPENPSDFFTSLWRLKSDGTTDTSFGLNGIAKIDSATYGSSVFAIDDAGNIFHADDYSIIKLSNTGVLDQSFGESGYYTITDLTIRDVDLQSSGKIIITLSTNIGTDDFQEIRRLKNNGTLDESFGEEGIRRIFKATGERRRVISNTAVAIGDEIISGGYFYVWDDYSKDYSLSLIKLTPRGDFKTNFGNNGYADFNLYEGSEEKPGHLAINPLGQNITVPLIRIMPDDSESLFLARFKNTRTFSTMNVSGDVSGIWDVDSVYVDGDIVVPLDETLTIKPGVKVYFRGEYKMDVYGQLIANGTENDNIYFLSEGLIPISTYPDYEGFWYGITFHSTDENSQPASTLDFCDLKYGFGRWLDEASSTYNRRFGGGLIFYKSTINLSNTKFTDCNDGHNKGGVITSILSNGALQNITMHSAGSISLLDSEVDIDGLDMSNSFGLYINNTTGFIKNAKVHDNRGYNNYGLIHFENSNFQLENCEILDNYFFGIMAKTSTLSIDRSLIKGNRFAGGYFIESNAEITECEVLENEEEGLWFNSVSDWQTVFNSTIRNSVIAKNGEAGLRFSINNNANIINSTIVDNTSSDSWGGIKVGSAEVNVTNSIVYNNGGNLDYQAGGEYTYSIIQGNYVGSDVATSNLQNVDPLFRDAANGDYHLQSIACGNDSNSPGIDTGDPTIADLVLDCASAGLGTYKSDIGAYGGENNRWDFTIIPQCHYSGEVSGVWECEIITIEGDITIPEGDTLRITDAVDKVLITGPYQITVNGVLLAIGPENDITDLGSTHIKFQGPNQSSNEAWHGIVFNNLNDKESGTSIIKNCRFDYANRLNAPNKNGGALLIYNSDSVVVKQSVFYANLGTLGGAVYIENSDAHIEDCYFQVNGKEARQDGEVLSTAGGAMYVKNSNPYLHKIIFLNNYSINGGGAVVLENSSPTMSNILMAENFTGGLGGAMQCFNGSSPSIVNMTSAFNIAEMAGGCFYLNPNSNPSIINSIMYGSSKPEIYMGDGVPSLSYSIIDGASSESYFGEGCLDVNPYFASGSRYKLSNNNCSFSDGTTLVSPAIDAGHPDSLDAVLDCYQGLGTQRADMGYYGGGSSLSGTGTYDYDSQLAEGYDLAQNFPNPFSSKTSIEFTIPKVENVQLKVYNILGQQVAELINKEMPAGTHMVQFEATSDIGQISAGFYFYQIKMGDIVDTKTMILKKRK